MDNISLRSRFNQSFWNVGLNGEGGGRKRRRQLEEERQNNVRRKIKEKWKEKRKSNKIDIKYYIIIQ